jgi:hypothetical protein
MRTEERCFLECATLYTRRELPANCSSCQKGISPSCDSCNNLHCTFDGGLVLNFYFYSLFSIDFCRFCVDLGDLKCNV